MVFRKLPAALTCASLLLLTPCFAATNNNYIGTLNDPSDGLSLLESAQDSMLSIENELLPKMMHIATTASSGTHSSTELQNLDSQFQDYKQKYAKILSQAGIGGSKVFNKGYLVFYKNDMPTYIDLAVRNSHSLGISNDNVETVDNAKVAISHLNSALLSLRDWISDADNNAVKNKTPITKNDLSNNSKTYFSSSKLLFKTPASANSALQSVINARNVMEVLLTKMQTIASKAASDATTSIERLNLNSQFLSLINEIDRVANTATFNNISAFDGSSLEINGINKSFDLPALTLKSVGLNNSNVSSIVDANQALNDLQAIHDRIHVWLVTGDFVSHSNNG